MENRTLYLFFRDRETGITQNMIDRVGRDKAREELRRLALLQIRNEGYSIPDGAKTAAVLHDEWLDVTEDMSSVATSALMVSVKWYFENRGRECEVTPFAYMGKSIRQFWIGLRGMLPLWVEDEEQEEKLPTEITDASDEAAANDEGDITPELDNGAKHKTPGEQKPSAPVYGSNALENIRGREDSSHSWRDVYVFISSTFNDMHAERNYLIKRVFPELSQWCSKHRLRLRDIDLRWGITEEDSQENLKTVEICLENIDRCRPFFLCFIGQRRGWVPSSEDIAKRTFELFPKLKDNIGRSVTEMEVIHSLIDPMRREKLSDEDAVSRAFFYLREPDYLPDIKSKKLIDIYTNSSSADPEREDGMLKDFRENTIKGTGRPVRSYSCRWDENGRTPELAAVRGASPDIVNGQLTDFTYEGKPLSERIIEDLRSAISQRYDINEKEEPFSELEQELEEQALFLYTAGEAFIERQGDLDPFEDYIKNDSDKPLILTAAAGMGKSSLLAHWILSSDHQICYRFIGRSRNAGTAIDLADSVWRQLYSDGRVENEPPMNPAELTEQFTDMLGEAAKEQKLILVIDALDQLPSGAGDLSFLPQKLPENVKLILSVKEETEDSRRYLNEARSYAQIIRVRPLEDIDDRNALVEAYLDNYLKKLSVSQQNTLVQSEGAANPLYLKIVLNELRVFGAYDSLQSHIEKDFGSTPAEAFGAMLRRLENDAPFSEIENKALAENVFGWLTHSRYGLEATELSELLAMNGVCSDKAEALDAVYIMVRQLRSFLTEREQRIDFFYDSFRLACFERYTVNKPSFEWHRELAEFFEKKPYDNAHRLLEQAYQYVEAGCIDDYLRYVFDFRYLSAGLEILGVQSLLKDFRLYDTKDTAVMGAFLSLCSGVLTFDRCQLAPRLLGSFMNTESQRISALLRQAEHEQKSVWLKPIIPCFEQPQANRDIVITTREDMSASVALLKNDTLAASIVKGHTIYIWDISTGKVELKIPAPKDNIFVCMRAADDGKKFAASYEDPCGGSTSVAVFESDGFRRILEFPIGGADVHYEHYGIGYIRRHRFEIIGDVLFLKDESNKIRAYSLNDGGVIAESDYRWNANIVAANDDGLMAVGNIHPQNNDKDYDLYTFARLKNPVYLLQLDQNNKTLTPLPGRIGSWRSHVETVAVSPDGRYIVGDDGQKTYVYDTESRELIKELGDGGFRVIRFLKKRGLLLCAGRTVALFDMKDYSLVREIRGLGFCNSAAISVDENLAVFRIGDQKLRVVSLSAAQEDDISYSVPSAIRSAAVSKNKKYVYASCYDNWIEHGKEQTAGPDDAPKLYAIERDTGVVKKVMRLSNRYKRDFTYLAPDGSAVVSKDFQEPEGLLFKYWPLPADPMEADDEIYGDSFLQKRERDLYFKHPFDIQLSSDRQYVVISEGNNEYASVFRAKTGRFLGKVSLKGNKPRRWGLFAKKKAVESEEQYTGSPCFEVSDDGSSLYAFFSGYENQYLKIYDIRGDKLVYSRTFIGEELYVNHSDYCNDLYCPVDGGRSFAFVSSSCAAVISTTADCCTFRIDRKEEHCDDDDSFAAVTEDGRYLAVSGKNDYWDLNWLVRIYDTERGAQLCSFVADGVIGEMWFEDDQKTLLFGMGNGRLARLRLTGI